MPDGSAADIEAYKIRLQSLWAYVRPSASLALEGYHHSNVNQHVLHHSPVIGMSNVTQVEYTVTAADPILKHLSVVLS